MVVRIPKVCALSHAWESDRGEGKRLNDNAPEYGSKRCTEADPVLGKPELPIELMRLQAPRVR